MGIFKFLATATSTVIVAGLATLVSPAIAAGIVIGGAVLSIGAMMDDDEPQSRNTRVTYTVVSNPPAPPRPTYTCTTTTTPRGVTSSYTKTTYVNGTATQTTTTTQTNSDGKTSSYTSYPTDTTYSGASGLGVQRTEITTTAPAPKPVSLTFAAIAAGLVGAAIVAGEKSDAACCVPGESKPNTGLTPKVSTVAAVAANKATAA